MVARGDIRKSDSRWSRRGVTVRVRAGIIAKGMRMQQVRRIGRIVVGRVRPRATSRK
jgi:hypothetical protein